jgi:hypothetical protein
MLLLLVHLYIVTINILCQGMNSGMLTAPNILINVNKSNFRKCKHGELELLFLKYYKILTFFFVSDVVSSEVKSRLGAVIR